VQGSVSSTRAGILLGIAVALGFAIVMRSEFIQGMGKRGDDFLILLDGGSV
jgi:RsiW-degrading membrane proteinase PrsW (M82 family)